MVRAQILVYEGQRIAKRLLGFVPHAESMILLPARTITANTINVNSHSATQRAAASMYPERLKSEISFMMAASAEPTARKEEMKR